MNNLPASSSVYCLIDEDVEAYLASHSDDDVIGYCLSPSGCLLAQVIRAKYKDVSVDIDGAVAILSGVYGAPDLPLSERQRKMLFVFDYRTHAQQWEPVTKADFMVAWRAYENRADPSEGEPESA